MMYGLNNAVGQSVFYEGKAYTISTESRDLVFISGTVEVVDWDSNERGETLFVTLKNFETEFMIDPWDFASAICKRDGHDFASIVEEDDTEYSLCVRCGYEEEIESK